MSQTIKIESTGTGVSISIDGTDISHMCVAADIKLRAGEPPQISIECAEPETILYVVEHGGCHSDELITAATAILRTELMKHGDLYNGYLASILSVLKPKERYIGDGESEIHAEFQVNYLAEEVLKRIIGEE